MMEISTAAPPKASLFAKALLPELIVDLIGYLHLENILACQLVSRAWQAAFTSPTIAPILCRIFFPALPRPLTLAAFQAECRRYFRRRQGNFTTRREHTFSCPGGGFTPDEDFHPGGVLPPCPREYDYNFKGYTDKKMIWMPDSDLICIDNLCTRKRRVLDTRDWPPDVNSQCPRWAGDSLLVHLHRWKRQPTEVYVVSTPLVVSPCLSTSNMARASYIHNIETDRGVTVPMCSDKKRAHILKNQALLVTRHF
ncbi:hypothetical protein IMZ48_03870 [Candidatus Bathyarchaeota archaeon]|nr:hypothetical protein [Candidatus Bathyarchaeota archaeon]